jgi:hypothetical protein
VIKNEFEKLEHRVNDLNNTVVNAICTASFSFAMYVYTEEEMDNEEKSVILIKEMFNELVSNFDHASNWKEVNELFDDIDTISNR